MEDYRAQFIDIYNKNVTRPGADRLLKWLEGTDFFTAPASTKFHGACECGLVMHSINVYNAMMQHFFTEGEDNPETFAVCALLHDVCKANFYKVSTRNVKNDATGQWEKVPFYQVADQLPYGHGEKSVYLIEHFMRLKTDEAIAIRWHMGGFDDAVRGGSFAVSDAYNRYPLAVNLPKDRYGCINFPIYPAAQTEEEAMMREPRFLLDWTPNYKPNNIIVFDDLHSNLQDSYEAFWDNTFAVCCTFMDPENSYLLGSKKGYTYLLDMNRLWTLSEGIQNYGKWLKDWN